MSYYSMLSVVLLVLAPLTLGADPFAPGDLRVQRVNGTTHADPSVVWEYLVFGPVTGQAVPVLIFITGLDGEAPASMYTEIGDQWGAKGVASVVLSRNGAPAPREEGKSLAPVIQWLRTNLNIPGTSLDWDAAFIGGHSAGNHVWCDYLLYSCSTLIKGVVMVDPVDGYDPRGMVPNFCTSIHHRLNYTVPGLIISTGLDGVPGREGVACAPDNMSNWRFYNAWAGPVWLVNATGYGHLDVGDPSMEEGGKLICASDKNPKGPFKRQVAGLVASFVDVVTGNTAAQAVLTNAAGMPVHSIANHTTNSVLPPYTAGCHYTL